MNRAVVIIALGAIFATLSGCESLEGKFENIPTCAIGEPKAYVISMYGPVGIGTQLTEKSGKVLCPVVFVKPLP